MLVEIILGALVGTATVTGLGIWYTLRKQKKDQLQVEPNRVEKQKDHTPPLSLDLPLEKRLRNALYDAERHEAKCWQEAERLYQQQIDLLKSIAPASHVALAQKELFFQVTHPKTKAQRFYYYRDVSKQLSETFLLESLAVLNSYQEHLEILETKIHFFQKLQTAHQEQLDKINGMQAQEEHWKKLKEHRKKVDALTENTDLEVQQLRQEALLEEIERELEFQQDCFEQYQKLANESENKLDQENAEKLRINIQQIIDQINDEPED